MEPEGKSILPNTHHDSTFSWPGDNYGNCENYKNSVMFSDKDNYCFYVLCSIEDVFHQLLHQATMSYAVSKIPKGIHMVLKLDLVTLL